jgi:hypothetical protein
VRTLADLDRMARWTAAASAAKSVSGMSIGSFVMPCRPYTCTSAP